MTIEEVKKHMNKKVLCRDNVVDSISSPGCSLYRLTGIIGRLERGFWKYSAELVDERSNSVIITRLDRLEKYKN